MEQSGILKMFKQEDLKLVYWKNLTAPEKIIPFWFIIWKGMSVNIPATM